MQKLLLCSLILLAVIGNSQLCAQEVHDEQGKEKASYEPSVTDIESKVEKYQRKASESLDSLSSKSMALANNTSDSLNHLAKQIETKTRGQIDSLQQKLTELKSTSNEPLEKIEELESKISARIDSLQQKLSGKMQPSKLEKYANTGQAQEITKQTSAISLPEMKKLSIPVIPSLGEKGTGSSISSADNLSNSLSSRITEQLGKYSSTKDDVWIKTDLSEYRQFSDKAGEYTEMIKDPSKIDQAIDAQAGQLSEFKTLNDEAKELAALKDLPESMLKDLKRWENEEALKEEAKQVVVEQATDYFADHQEELSQAQSLMTKLKKKYSYIPDSRDLSTAVKATSLEREPLRKRFVPGLGFQFHRTNPISIDLSPNLLYRLNTLFVIGVSATARISTGIENSKSNNQSQGYGEDVYGASAFTQYKVWKGFFAHGEFQYMSTPYVDPTTDNSTRRWQEGLMVGIGKQFYFSSALRGQMIFTYDVLHSEFSPNPKPWNIKFGFQLGQFKLKNIQI